MQRRPDFVRMPPRHLTAAFEGDAIWCPSPDGAAQPERLNVTAISRAISVAVVLLYWFIGSAQADSPLPAPATHRVSSSNGKFAAVSDPATGTIIVDASSGKALWSIPGWFRSIHLSNDGRYLATGYSGLNLIPLNADDSLEMITFWDRGQKLRTVRLRAIVPDRSILRRTVSHYAWGTLSGINDSNQLVVTRVDGREFRFNMATGAVE